MEMSDESVFVCDVIALSPPPSFSLSSSYYILYYTTIIMSVLSYYAKKTMCGDSTST